MAIRAALITEHLFTRQLLIKTKTSNSWHHTFVMNQPVNEFPRPAFDAANGPNLSLAASPFKSCFTSFDPRRGEDGGKAIQRDEVG